MTTSDIEQIYQSQIKPLTHEEQLRLVAMITRALAQGSSKAKAVTGKRNILELEGVGAEIWKGIDAQEYVNQRRHEWDEGEA